MSSENLWGAWRALFSSAVEAEVTAVWVANRLVKGRARSTRRAFYEVKDYFVRRYQPCLIDAQRVRVETRTCRDCGGSGDDGLCDRCEGSGVWSERTLYLHRFLIEGRRYSFHSYEQPARVSDEPGEDLESYGGRFTQAEIDDLALPASGLVRMLRWLMLGGPRIPVPRPAELQMRFPGYDEGQWMCEG